MRIPTLPLWLAAGAALTVLAAAAQDAPRSLSEARKSVNEGRTPGVVIWEPKKRPVAAAAAAASGAGAAASAASTGKSPGFLSTLRELHPPSGQPLNRAKMLNSPSDGIPLTTAPAASAARR